MKRIKKISYSITSFVVAFSILCATCLFNVALPTLGQGIGSSEDTVYNYKDSWNDSALWNRYILNQNAGNFTESTIVSGSYSTVNYFNFVAPKDGEITIKLDATVTHGNGTTERFYISKAECDVASVPLTTAAAKPSPTPDFDQTSSYEDVLGVFPAARNGISFANAIGGTGYIVNGTSALSVDTKTTVKAGQMIVFALFSNKTSYTLNISEFTVSYTTASAPIEDDSYEYSQYWNNSALWNRYILNQNAGNFTASTIVSGSYSTVNYFNFVAPKDGEITIKLDATVTHGNGTTERFYISKAECDVATVPLTTAAAKPSPTPDFDQTSSYEDVLGVFPAARNGISFANAIGGTGYIVNGTSALSVDTKTTVKAGQMIVFALFSNKTSYTLNISDFSITYTPPAPVIKDVYDYINDFSTSQGDDGWYFQPVANNNYDDQIFKDNSWQHKSSTKTAKFGADILEAPLNGYVARIEFKAPKTGTIRIEQKFTVSGGGSGELRYGILKNVPENNSQSSVYPLGVSTNLTNGKKYKDSSSDDITVSVPVMEGQQIWFVMVDTSTETTPFKINLDKFVITYTSDEYIELPVYENFKDFSDKQGPVWYYMTSEAQSNFISQLEMYNKSSQRWQTDENAAYITGAVGNHFMQPWGTDDAVLGFKAPYTGRVNIIATNTYVHKNSIDGVNLSILKGIQGIADKGLYPSSATKDSLEIRPGKVHNVAVEGVDVKKGEWIYFRVNANGSWSGDLLYIRPIVQYIDSDIEDAGIVDIPDFDKPYITEKKHTESGNNLSSEEFPYVERTVSGINYTEITSENFIKGIADGTLAKGGYEISDGILQFDGQLNNKITDLSGYYVKAQNIVLNSVKSARIKNLTAILTGKDTLIKTDGVRDCRIMGWQVSYSGTNEAELMTTVGTATDAQKADLVIDSMRFIGNGNVKGITFNDSVKYATVINSYITGVKEYAVKDSGESLDGVYIGNNYIEGDIKLNKDYATVKYNTVKGNVALGGNFSMVAMSNISGNIAASDKQSVSILKNTVSGNIALANGNSCAVVENTAEKITVTGGKYCIVENNNSAGRGKDGKPVASVTVDKNNTDHYGSNVYDQSERETVGVNKDLLAKADNRTFVGIERKTYVNDNGNIKAVGEFVEDNAELEDDVFLSPGAYTLNSARMYDKKGLDLYFYCSLFEATTSRASYWNFTLNNSENCSLRGLTIGYNEAALGQGKVTEVGYDYFIVESMPGYYPDMSINEYYIQNFYTLIYREGSTAPAAKSNFTGTREYLGNGLTKFEKIVEYEDVCVGDTFAARVRGNRFIQYDNNTNCLTEDLTAYASVEAAIGDQWGNKNYYNRLLSLPGYGYEVDPSDEKLGYWQEKGWITEYEGKYYGPEAIWSVSDFVNANENAVGPQVTNYKANQRHDDAFNIHGVYSAVTSFDEETNTITYDTSASSYGSITKAFKKDDEIFIYFPATGEVLYEGKVTSDTVNHENGKYYTVTLAGSMNYRPGAVLFNLSAIGNGFLYDNCEMRMSYPRGGVIKAKGTMQYCTFSDIGRAAILVSPEIVDTTFCECGFTNGLNLLYNDIKNTNLTEALSDQNSAVAFVGYSKKLDGNYAKHKNIKIIGNRFENWGAHAIYMDSVEDVVIKDNIFIDDKSYDDERVPIYIAGSQNVEISGNTFPEEFEPIERIDVGDSNIKNIFGDDIGDFKCLGDYIKISSKTVCAENNWMILVEVENVNPEPISVELSKIRCSLVDKNNRRAENIPQGETAKFYFPLKNMQNVPEKANFIYNITVNDEISLKNIKAPNIVFTQMPYKNMDESNWKEVVNTNLKIEYKINFWYDEDYLYLTTVVKDDVHLQQIEEDKNIWEHDCLEFSIDPGRLGGDGAAGWSHFGVALRNGEVIKYRWENTLSGTDVSAMQADVTRDEEAKITTYLVKAPWSLVGANGKAPVDGDLYGISVKVTDVDNLTDDYLYLKWYDIKSVNNQAGYVIQRTPIKAFNIKADNENISISTPIALEGDRVYATFNETDKLLLKKWIISAEDLRIDGNFASFTVGEDDITVNAEETIREIPQDDEKEENEDNSPSKDEPDNQVPPKNEEPSVNDDNQQPENQAPDTNTDSSTNGTNKEPDNQVSDKNDEPSVNDGDQKPGEQTQDMKPDSSENDTNKEPENQVPNINDKPSVDNENQKPSVNNNIEEDYTLVIIIISSAIAFGIIILSAATLFFLMLMKKKRSQIA